MPTVPPEGSHPFSTHRGHVSTKFLLHEGHCGWHYRAGHGGGDGYDSNFKPWGPWETKVLKAWHLEQSLKKLLERREHVVDASRSVVLNLPTVETL